MKMKTGIIAAVTTRGLYGVRNSLPWPSLTEDIKRFMEHTVGQVVIMGRSTFDSLPEKYKPLPNRKNIVVSKTIPEGENFYNNDTKKLFYVCKNIDDAYTLATACRESNIFFIGGRRIWLEAIKYCNKAFITIVDMSNSPQLVKGGPMNFVHELLDPDIIFKEIGGKNYIVEKDSSFNQEIRNHDGDLIDTVRLRFLDYDLMSI